MRTTFFPLILIYTESFYVWGLFLISPNNFDTVWFIRIKELCIAETSSKDDCGHAVVAGQSFIIGNFLERSRSNSKWHYFKVDSKTFYFYLESIVYSLAQFTEKKNEIFIKNSEYFQIIHFVEHMGMAPLSSLWFYTYYFSVHCYCWYLVLGSYYS